MKSIDCTTIYLPLLCNKLDYVPTPMAQCISCIEDGTLIAGVVYDTYNGMSMLAHIYIAEGKVPTREWYAAIMDYPFNRLGINKLLGQVSSSNARARMLDEHFGFVLEATVKDFSEKGDLLLYTMTKDQCKILNSPLWSRTVEHIRRVA